METYDEPTECVKENKRIRKTKEKKVQFNDSVKTIMMPTKSKRKGVKGMSSKVQHTLDL